ncbi:hypothetical protein SCLCIDRAFT_642341 [Scleroderma citrinum Foug A]|uniref:DUF6533 domain-containing protein n=1 Tax=Scleroderma citrinum Foug A TaxID=1036808 RepID=A0A0C3AH87_9AGAM|nr:hypothetical protein SCLCIDRAFT_642341 [Scleroderma citrinum Foug A]
MSTDVQSLINWISGLQLHYEVQFAMITFMIYDHATTLGQEVDLFWYSKWNLSKALYLTIRYLSVVLVGLLLYSNAGKGYGITTAFLTGFALSAVLMALCQGWSSPCFVYSDDSIICKAAIVIRVWYLFARNRLVRTIAVSTFVATTIASIVLIIFSTKDIKLLLMSTTVPPVSRTLVWMLVPSLIIHTVLFALKVYRFSQSSRSLHVEAPLRRFLKEGMLLYAFVTGTIVFDMICLSCTDSSQLSILFVGLTSFPTAAAVVSVCHIMLSINSLASTLHVDPEWLLNHAEMARLHFREGVNKGELCVDIY